MHLLERDSYYTQFPKKTRTEAMTDPADLIERARDALAAYQPVQVDEPGAARAAVALVLARQPALSVLLVRRRERAGDPWSGHMALPGGYSSTSDATLAVTATRETMEETGLDLAAAEQLGALSDVAPRSPFLPPIIVRPFVYVVPATAPGPANDEVDEVIWFDVSELFDASNRKPLVLDFPGGARTFDSIQVRGYTIWGLTERILTQFGGLVGIG